MAINYGPGEALKVLKAGTDAEAIKDICKRYPLFTVAVLQGDIQAIMDAIPNYVSARQINSRLAGEADGEGEGGEETEKVPPKKEEKKAEKPPATGKDGKGNKGGGKPPAKKDEKKAEAEEESWGDEAPDFSKMDKNELSAALKERGLKPEKGATKAQVVKMLEDHEKTKNESGGSGASDDEWDV
jgi:hypothetical protein